jgi:ribose-phosphate pyrophosphokinase
MDRAVYFANNLGVDMGMFYKRRDYSQVVNGKNPIVAHEFLGSNVEGKTVIIIDDMISSGDSMLDTSRELRERGAEKIIICCTFGLFTNGLSKFDEFYHNGFIDYVVTTNLNYRDPELLTKPWYIEADLSSFTADIIHNLNRDSAMSAALDPTAKIQKLLAEYNARTKEFTQLQLDL